MGENLLQIDSKHCHHSHHSVCAKMACLQHCSIYLVTKQAIRNGMQWMYSGCAGPVYIWLRLLLCVCVSITFADALR